MPKYRLLTTEELNQLEQIFINFLAANSITAKDWESIKSDDQARMSNLIEEFSNVVFEKTLNNVKLLEKRLQNKILMYRFAENSILLEGIEVEGSSPIDFRGEFNFSSINEMLANPDLKISFIEGNKPYFEEKNKEIFALMESGAMISQNEDLFEALKNLRNNYSED